MKRIFQCIFILSLLCMPLISEAITVTLTEVDPYWRPEASTKDNLSVAWLTVTISGIDPKKDQYKRVIISLNGVTTEKGICCNGTYEDYVKDAALKKVYRSTTKDMIFRKEENAGWEILDIRRLRYEVPSDEKKIKTTVTLPVGVLSLDFGGYGEVHGAVEKKKRWSDKYETDSSAGKITYVQVPRDKNENKIADSWNNDYYSPAYALTGDTRLLRDFGRLDDEDTSPNTNYEGDHITAFEEYRGFLKYASNKPTLGKQKVKHTDTSPDTKDMFVVNEDSETKLYGTGVEHSRISQHLLPSSLVKDDGWVNFTDNKGLTAFSVKVVSTTAATSGKKVIYGKVDRYGPPDANYEATIYTTQIALKEAAGDVGAAISSTIGHELGHAAHIAHCPKSDIKDANGKDKGWGKICMMWPDSDSAQNTYASHHDVDYALATPVQDPQTPVELDDKGKPLPKKAKLVPYNGAYTANAGDSHTAKFTAPAAYSSVYWYVKTPSDTSTYGTSQEIDQGDGSTTTADFTYTFPSGVNGKYQIMAYVYGSDNTVYEEKYTVTVKATTTTTTTTTGGSTTPTYSLTSSDGSYTATAGGSHTANFTTSSAYSSVYWYVRSPSGSGLGTNVETDTGDSSSTTTASLTYTFPTTASGDYVITAYVYPAAGSIYQTSYTVTVGTTTTPATPAAFTPTFTSDKNRLFIGHLWTGTVTANQDMHGVQLFLKKPSDTSYYGKKTAHFVGGTGVRRIDLKHYFHKHTSVVGTYKVSVRVLEMGKNMWSKHHYLSENVTIIQ